MSEPECCYHRAAVLIWFIVCVRIAQHSQQGFHAAYIFVCCTQVGLTQVELLCCACWCLQVEARFVQGPSTSIPHSDEQSHSRVDNRLLHHAIYDSSHPRHQTWEHQSACKRAGIKGASEVVGTPCCYKGVTCWSLIRSMQTALHQQNGVVSVQHKTPTVDWYLHGSGWAAGSSHLHVLNDMGL